MTHREVLSESAARFLARWGAVERGSFILSNGDSSDIYVNVKAALSTGARLAIMGNLLCTLADEVMGFKYDVRHGIASGGVPLALAMAMDGGKSLMRSERVSWSKHNANGYWMRHGAQIESSDGVLLVEDVLTTGETVGEERGTLWHKTGARADSAIAVVDRSDGAATAMLEGEYGIQAAALCTLDQILAASEVSK